MSPRHAISPWLSASYFPAQKSKGAAGKSTMLGVAREAWQEAVRIVATGGQALHDIPRCSIGSLDNDHSRCREAHGYTARASVKSYRFSSVSAV
jgi:hypothetical protein